MTQFLKRCCSVFLVLVLLNTFPTKADAYGEYQIKLNQQKTITLDVGGSITKSKWISSDSRIVRIVSQSLLSCTVEGVDNRYGTTATITCNYTYLAAGALINTSRSYIVSVPSESGSSGGGSSGGSYYENAELVCSSKNVTLDPASDTGEYIIFTATGVGSDWSMKLENPPRWLKYSRCTSVDLPWNQRMYYVTSSGVDTSYTWERVKINLYCDGVFQNCEAVTFCSSCSHKYGEGVISRNPTTTSTGEIVYTCSACKCKKRETIPMLEKQSNTVTVSNIVRGYSSKNQTVMLNATAKGNAKLTYSTNSSAVTVYENGKVTIPGGFSGCVKITVTAQPTSQYKLASRQIILIVPTAPIISQLSPGTDKLSLKWQCDSTAQGCEIQYSKDKTFQTGTRSVSFDDPTVTQTTISALNKGVYYVRIRSVNGQHCSKWSALKSAEVNPSVAKAGNSITIKNPPTSVQKGKSVKLNASGYGKITLKSSNTKVASVSGMYVRGVGAGTATITITAAGDNTHLAAAKTLMLTVYPCGTPSLPKLQNVPTGLRISWAKTTGASKYRIFHKYSNRKWAKLADTTALSYTWTKAVSGVQYTFAVCTLDSKGACSSDYIHAGRSIRYLAAPKLENNAAKKLKVSWKIASGVTGYQVAFATSGHFSGAKTVTVKNARTRTTTINGLKKGTTYFVRLRTFTIKSGKTTYSAWSCTKSLKLTQ